MKVAVLSAMTAVTVAMRIQPDISTAQHKTHAGDSCVVYDYKERLTPSVQP